MQQVLGDCTWYGWSHFEILKSSLFSQNTQKAMGDFCVREIEHAGSLTTTVCEAMDRESNQL